MSWAWGDGFDCYATTADMINGYWDSGANIANVSLVTGRFTGSQALQMSSITSVACVKSSGQNDAVHHIVCGFRQTAAISGTNSGIFFNLLDGAGVFQCTIVFRSDGAILLQSGSATGTTLATYTGAFSVANTWYAFEMEVVIHNTAGSFTVRKNGNTSSDFTATGLNTRAGSSNNYANRLSVGMSVAVNTQQFDDLFWRSDASSVAWLGDIRCYTRMPASDSSVTFSRTPTNFFAQNNALTNTGTLSASNIRATSVVGPTTGTLASLQSNFNAGITGHAKMALYDASGVGGGAGALLASSAELTNPGAGINTFSVTGGPTVTRGTTYWVALWSDVSITGTGSSATINIVALTYTTAFPSTMVGFTTSSIIGVASNGMNVTSFNAGCVNESQQNTTTDYVYDSTVNDADFYTIAPIASTPSSTIAVTTRAYMLKSDAGSRTAAVQLKSGSTTVASPTVTLTTSGWQWAWRTDIVDPNTSSAWVPANVDSVTAGPKIIS